MTVEEITGKETLCSGDADVEVDDEKTSRVIMRNDIFREMAADERFEKGSRETIDEWICCNAEQRGEWRRKEDVGNP